MVSFRNKYRKKSRRRRYYNKKPYLSRWWTKHYFKNRAANIRYSRPSMANTWVDTVGDTAGYFGVPRGIIRPIKRLYKQSMRFYPPSWWKSYNEAIRKGFGGNTEIKHLEELLYDHNTGQAQGTPIDGIEADSAIETSTSNDKIREVFIPQPGSAYNQRLGNSVRVIGLGLMIKIEANSSGSNHQYLRLMLFQEYKPQSSLMPSPSQIIDVTNNAGYPGTPGTGVIASEETPDVLPINHWYKNHYKFIFDKQFHLIKDVSGDNEKRNTQYFQTFLKLNIPVTYGMYDSTTKTTNVPTKNKLYVMGVSTEPTNYPTFTIRMTWKYYDD